MAIYQPISEEQKPEWIDWLQGVANDLNGLQEDGEPKREILQTEAGDLFEVKKLVGLLLANLSGQVVTID